MRQIERQVPNRIYLSEESSMTVTLTELGEGKRLLVSLSGKLQSKNCEKISPVVESPVPRHGLIRV